MATSAAALALYMGVYDVKTETIRKLQMVLGFNFGKALISDLNSDVAGSTISCCRVRATNHALSVHALVRRLMTPDVTRIRVDLLDRSLQLFL